VHLRKTTIGQLHLLFNESFILRTLKENNWIGCHPDTTMNQYLSFIESVTFIAHDEYCKAEDIENKHQRELMSANILELKASDFPKIHLAFAEFMTSNIYLLYQTLQKNFTVDQNIETIMICMQQLFGNNTDNSSENGLS